MHTYWDVYLCDLYWYNYLCVRLLRYLPVCTFQPHLALSSLYRSSCTLYLRSVGVRVFDDCIGQVPSL